jgi:hypothetical protein
MSASSARRGGPDQGRDFARSLQNLANSLEHFIGASEDERKRLRRTVDPRVLLRVGTALVAFVNESDFQGWCAMQKPIPGLTD